MGVFQKLFKREQKTKEDLMRDIFERTKNVKLDMRSIEKLAIKNPDRMIFQGVKNPEENRIRHHALYFSMNGDYKRAIERATKGIKINPKSAYLFYIRGRSKGDVGLFDGGIKDLDEAIKLKPDYADAFVERGYIEQRKGNPESARKDYEKAKKIDPSVELPEEEMVIPTGLTFKFIVKPELTKEHQTDFRYVLLHESGLSQYYKIVDIDFSKNFENGQMLIKVFCPEPIVAIEKLKEDEFYNQMEEKFSEWIVNTLKNNKYECKLYEFNHTVRLA